jgi:hypothetical protein
MSTCVGGGSINRTLSMIEEVQTAGKQQGFRLTRLWANMEWALEDLRGVHDIVEYEARLNYLLPNYNDVVVCTYDVTKFSASVVVDIMRSHHKVIVGGVLRENPFYAPPDDLLRDRGAERAVSWSPHHAHLPSTSGALV